MDKLKWIEKIAQHHPEDAETRYWFAKELEAQGHYVEALAEYGKGLAVCSDDALRQHLITALKEASLAIQG